MHFRKSKNLVRASVITILIFASANFTLSQNSDYLYCKNFVRHANGDVCKHTPPGATFQAFLNSDQTKILTETAPRWIIGGDPNIPGNGIFGVELGNFTNPEIMIGDTVFIRFTCNETRQQGVLSGVVTGIPWITFPQTLTLSPVALPNRPQNLALKIEGNKLRILSWSQEPNVTYSIYRRSLRDTVRTGHARMMYHRIADGILAASFQDTTALINEKYGYIICAVSDKKIISSHSEEANEAPVIHEGDDLTIGWIARLPRIDYVWGSANPKVEGWPAEGQTITWQAVVKNWTSLDLPDVQFKWYLDNVEILSGNIAIPAGDTAAIMFSSSWTFDRHELKLVIDPDNLIPEEEEKNNQLSIYTDAISAGFYVEQSVYDYFHQNQKKLNVHSNCWEDWAQRHVRRWNQMFANALSPDTPDGVLDRIRIDRITVVPDRALPLAGGDYPTNFPNLKDRTVDLQWGFPTTLLDGDMYKNHTSVSDNNAFYFEGSLLHELGHARYLIDLYGFNVHDNGAGNTVAIKENGKLIVGTPYLPLTGDAVHYTPFKGLMNGEYTYVDRYSAVALNLIAGHRATMGNYNSPGNIGIFMNDFPSQNLLTVKDSGANLLAYADVKIFRATAQPGVWYGKYFDDKPDLILSTDETGQVLLDRCPFDAAGRIVHDYGHSNAVVIVRVESDGKVGYTFLESTSFNMEYWHGNTELGNYEITVKLVEPPLQIRSASECSPTEFDLLPCYPNPFNSITTIQFSLPRAGFVSLQIFDMNGRIVTTLIDAKLGAGHYSRTWTGTDANASSVASGIYFIRLTWNDYLKSQKAIYIK